MKKSIFGTALLIASVSLLPYSYFFAQSITAGAYSSLSICTDHTISAWGNNHYGQFGNGFTQDVNSTATSTGITTISNFSTGNDHTVFIKSDSTVWACGRNNRGQLGNGTTTDTLSPIQVDTLSGITKVAAGRNISFFLAKDSMLWACGWDEYGKLGDGAGSTDRYRPVQLVGLTGIIDVKVGQFHSVALKRDGTVWSFGRNAYGELGDGTATNRYSPIQVKQDASTYFTNVTKIAAGGRHLLFIKSDSTVWACGLNDNGQLGDGTITNRSYPVQVSGLTKVVAIAGHYYGSLFLKSDSTVWACGRNNSGQLGDGTTTNRTTPVQVSGLTGIAAIAAGVYDFSLFLKGDRTVWACGSNVYGQLGDGTTTNSSIPILVTGLCPVLLPIELLSFNASREGNKVRLYWSTASETNNSYFTIERSTDGENFESIGTEKGAGNSSSIYNYNFWDENPLQGVSYYRLKQTDFDGKYSYSKIIAINVDQNGDFSIFPNPSNGSFAMQLSSKKEADVLVVMQDVLGREVYSSRVKISAGSNMVGVNPGENIPSGVYYVIASSYNNLCKSKIIIDK